MTMSVRAAYKEHAVNVVYLPVLHSKAWVEVVLLHGDLGSIEHWRLIHVIPCEGVQGGALWQGKQEDEFFFHMHFGCFPLFHSFCMSMCFEIYEKNKLIRQLFWVTDLPILGKLLPFWPVHWPSYRPQRETLDTWNSLGSCSCRFHCSVYVHWGWSSPGRRRNQASTNLYQHAQVTTLSIHSGNHCLPLLFLHS